MATGTWPNVNTVPAGERAFTLHMIDASGDLWTERLVTALAATLAAVQAWIVLYQAVTQASVYQVTEENIWTGAMDSGNATFLARSGGETGINLSFRNATTGVLFPLRAIAPVPDAMEGTLDLPDIASDEIVNLVTATSGLKPGFALSTAQYTVHRERKGNARVR